MIPEQPKKWFELNPSQKIEAIRNLSRTNFLNGSTDPVLILQQIEELLKSGEISTEVSKELRRHIKDSVPKRHKI